MVTIGGWPSNERDKGDWMERLFKWAFSTMIVLGIMSVIATFVLIFIFGDKVFEVITNIIG